QIPVLQEPRDRAGDRLGSRRHNQAVELIDYGLADASLGDGNDRQFTGVRLQRDEAERLEAWATHEGSRPPQQLDERFVVGGLMDLKVDVEFSRPRAQLRCVSLVLARTDPDDARARPRQGPDRVDEKLRVLVRRDYAHPDDHVRPVDAGWPEDFGIDAEVTDLRVDAL